MLGFIVMAGSVVIAKKYEEILNPTGETKRIDLTIVTIALKRPMM